jgi:cytochrome c2
MLKRTTVILSLVLIVVLLALTACGGGGAAKPAGGENQPAAAPGGNAVNGKKLFNEPVIASAGSPGCATCHSLEKDKTLVGPSLAGIAADGEKTVKEADYKGKAKTGTEWLRESILDPNVDVPEGFKPDIMPKTYTKLSAQELNDLVAYLQTLK